MVPFLKRPGGGLALDPAPDAIHAPPAHADICRVGDVPTAWAVGFADATDALGIHGQRLVLGYPEEEHRCLENAPAPEPDVETEQTRELLPGPSPGGHVEVEGNVGQLALRPLAARAGEGEVHVGKGAGADELVGGGELLL
eukprot:7940528-Alexandrium_andersonii.AAC.1